MAASVIGSPSISNVSVQSAYRTTCDNCMNSKVRCSKDHPSCRRCLGQGVTCVYSPSRRLKKVVDFHGNRQLEPATNGNHANVGLSRTGKEHTTLRNDCTSSSASPTAADRIHPSPWNYFDNGDVQGPLVGMEDIDQSDSSLTALNEPLSDIMKDWPTHHWSQSMESSAGGASIPMSPDTSVDFLSSLCTYTGDSSSTSDPYQRALSPGFDFSGNDNSKPSCAWIAASVLQSLESPGAPLEHDSHQGKLRRNLDTVISTNKSVMEIVPRISRCTCSVPGNHLVIISSVLFIVLAWYEACLGACDRASEQVWKTGSENVGTKEKGRRAIDGSKEADAILDNDSIYSGIDDRAKLVFIPPIRVGSLQLSLGSRRQVVAQMILTELAKVTNVMEGFTDRSSGTTSPMGGYQDLEGQLRFSLQVALQMRIEKIFQAAERASK